MKKGYAVIITIIFVISILSGCGNTRKDIELTTDNVTDYFQFDSSYENLESHTAIGLIFTYTDVVINIYPVVSGSLANVKMKVEVNFPVTWKSTSNESAPGEEDDSKVVLDIVLPADGKYTSIQRIGRIGSSSKPTSACTFKIIEVSGTFTPY